MQEKVNGVYQPLYPQTYWQQVIGADNQIATVNNRISTVQANLQGQINQKQDASTAITTSNIYNYYLMTPGYYTGTGEIEKTITLPFTPKLVYVALRNGNMGTWIPEGSGDGRTYTYGGLAVSGRPAQTWRTTDITDPFVVQIVTNGFKVFDDYYSVRFTGAHSNQSGYEYNFIAFG